MTYDVIEWTRSVPSVGTGVIALGVFDGVHLGHQDLLATAIAAGRKRGVPVAAVTFDRDPDQVVTPESAAPQLLTLEEKTAFLGECGVDHVIVLPFCVKISKLPPEMFVRDILAQAIKPEAIVVGEDFRFGNHASGDVATLLSVGDELDFEVIAHELLESDAAPITSTRIRTLIAKGSVKQAATLLGREHRITGRVAKGRGEGARAVVPTANVAPHKHAAVPADGVYAGRTLVDDEWHPAAISVGSPPMFPGSRRFVEAHIIDFDRDIYGAELTVAFTDRIRDLATFSDLAALKEQVDLDVEAARAILG